jgi:hypothetical protein
MLSHCYVHGLRIDPTQLVRGLTAAATQQRVPMRKRRLPMYEFLRSSYQ